MIWLEKRMADLDLTIEEVARRVGVSESAVKNWLYVRSKTFAPEETERWDRLLEILQWSWLDVLNAIGYELRTDYPPEQLHLLDRLNKIPTHRQAYCVKMLEAVLAVCESTDVDELL